MAATAYALARRAVDRRLERPSALTPAEALIALEDGGYITPRCPDCAHVYKDAIAVAERLTANPRWRPATSHVASPDCRRTRQPHCPCGACTGRGGRA